MRSTITALLTLASCATVQAFCYQSDEMIPCTTQPSAEQTLKVEKRTRLNLYFTAAQARTFLSEHGTESLFIDVRTRGEYMYVGSAEGLDAHIPYMEVSETARWDAKAKRYELEPNSDFLVAVAARAASKGLSKSEPIVLICRSGDRSAKAADLLMQAGYTQVYTVTDGFEGDLDADGRRNVNGWRKLGLPWSYPSTRHVAYLQ
jgi:rhodanese-related sulfurtransferase